MGWILILSITFFLPYLQNTMALGAEFMILVLSIILLVYYISKYAFKYWQRCGIPFIPPTFLIGNMKEILLLEESPADIMRNFYNHVVARAQPVFGIFLFYTPALIIRDLNLIKRILIKDFNHFANRWVFITLKRQSEFLSHFLRKILNSRPSCWHIGLL